MEQRWCTLVGIDASNGGVTVQYDNETSDVLISPDYLVGVPSVNSKENQKKPSGSRKRSWEGAFDEEFYIGVFNVRNRSGEDNYYMRGLLQKDSNHSIPYLVTGECVKYNSEGVSSSELLIVQRFNNGDYTYLRPVSKKDKDKCKHYASLAETEDAAKIREELVNQRRRSSMAEADSLRPLQPVFVIGAGEAVVIRVKDETGFLKVQLKNSKKIETKRYSEVRLIGHKPEPVDLDAFFRGQLFDMPQERQSYKEENDFLLTEWRTANTNSTEFENEFERRVEARDRKRALASDDGTSVLMTADTMRRLEERAKMLLKRLQEDVQRPVNETMMDREAIKARLVEIKNIDPSANVLLLCGGIGPEVTAYKRLGVPLGIVIIQDIDLHAVGVAVAAHPDVHFAIVRGHAHSQYSVGDVRILLDQEIVRQVEIKLGGISNASMTNPCITFSLAGLKETFNSEHGQLFHDCVAAVRAIEESSDMPMYLAENVPSTVEANQRFDAFLPHRSAAYFYACGSMCSPCKRRRKFATNRPPAPGGHGQPGGPPTLNGDLPEVSAKSILQDGSKRFVHPYLQKFPCLTHRGPKCQLIWQQNDEYSDPVATLMTPEEAECAMGYKGKEIGVTAYSAEKAVRKRIDEHVFERDGHLISLKGCADDKTLLEPVHDNRRLELLGNSQVIPLLEALMFNDKRMFPAVSEADQEDQL